jgi:fused signal recognition particle receptor
MRKKPAEKRRWFRRSFDQDGEGGEAEARSRSLESETSAQTQIPPELPPELPPEVPPELPREPPTPAPGPNVIPPPESPEPELPPPGSPTPEIPPEPELLRLRTEAGAAAPPMTARSAAEAEWIERRAREVRAQVAEEDEKVGWLGRLKRGLGRSSAKLTTGIGDLFTNRRLDDEALEELEELLITGDLGIETSARLARALAEARFGQEVTAEEVRAALAEEVAKVLEPVARTIAINDAYRPHVILVCGVNGSGKTTTTAKLAWLFKHVGLDVMLAAGDTFRAAAIEQLQIWGKRIGAEVIAHKAGADPAAVVFDACKAATARRVDRLLIDTAGRLHTRQNLMEELKKIRRVIARAVPGAPHETLLVLDATTGLNAIAQAREFHQAVGVTGLVIAKLDGTAKGGAVVAIAQSLQLPVRYVGVGESPEDLQPFDPLAFASALFS